MYFLVQFHPLVCYRQHHRLCIFSCRNDQDEAPVMRTEKEDWIKNGVKCVSNLSCKVRGSAVPSHPTSTQTQSIRSALLSGFLQSPSLTIHTRINKALAIKTQTDMCPQVHKPHVDATLTHAQTQNSLSCVASVCVYIFFKFQRQWKHRVFSSTGGPPICTTGSQQPKQPPAFSCHGCCPDPQGDRSLLPPILTTHTHPATRLTVRKDGTAAACLGPNLDEDTKLQWKLRGGTGRTLWRSSSALT